MISVEIVWTTGEWFGLKVIIVNFFLKKCPQVEIIGADNSNRKETEMKMKHFVCPACGNKHHIDEVIVSATIINEVRWLDEEGLSYGPVGNIKDGEILGYQCAGCGYKIPGITSPEELVEYIEIHGK